MAKKGKGINKNLRNLVVSSIMAGTIIIGSTAGALGFGIYNAHKDNLDPTNNNQQSTDTINPTLGYVPEQSVQTESGTEYVPEFDTFVPEIQDDINAGNSLDETTVKALALLTNTARDYFESVTGRTTDLEQTSYDYIKIDNEGIVTIYGKCITGSKTKRIATTIQNPNTSLDIYNLADYISPEEFNQKFATALEDVLSLPQTKTSVKVENYYKVSNVNITKGLLQNYLNELKASNSNSQEIAYITNLLSEPDKLELLIVDASSIQTDLGDYKNVFTLLLSTEKYGYSAQGSFDSTFQLRADDRYPTIENYLAGNLSSINLDSTPQSAINEMLYQINEAANEMQDENSLTK